MSLFGELKRRNVLRIGAAYLVTAWLVAQVVETVFPVYGLSDAAIRLVFTALAVGLVPVLVLAWAFELTPEGLRLDSGEEVGPPLQAGAHKRFDRWIMALLAVALGYFAFDKFVLDPARDAARVESARAEGRSEALVESFGDQSIAVLAFRDMSAQGDQEYLGDGIAEEILNLLAQLPELRVISRSSAFTFKGQELPIPEIAEKLNVAHVLEGSVRKAGDRIRITAQLIDGRSDTHLWSDTYDRTLDDVFAIQDELAAAIVEQLHMKLLGGAPTAQRVDTDAYYLFLQGRFQINQVQYEAAIEALEQAIELEPDYAEAWAELSRAYFQAAHDNDPEEKKARLLELSKAAGRTAVELNPDLPGAMLENAWAAMDNADLASSARLFGAALDRHPRDRNVLLDTLIFAQVIHRFELACELGARALQIDPLCRSCNYMYSRALRSAGRFEDSIREIERFRDALGRQHGELSLGTAYLMLERMDEAAEAFGRYNEEYGRAYGRLLIAARQGATASFDEEVSSFGEEFGDQWAHYVAHVYAQAGRPDPAFEWLERAIDGAAFHRRNLMMMGSPLFWPLHEDPRWQELEARLGISPQQQENIVFDPKLQ